MKLPVSKFESEADLVQAFCADLAKSRVGPDWTVYHETGGFDLLLVHAKTAIQLGIEAKLSLNVKVLTQAIPSYYSQDDGPDYRGVLVPFGTDQAGVAELAEWLGLGVITFRKPDRFSKPHYNLPDENGHWSQRKWHSWLPTRRCTVPDYIPDVVGGKRSPLQLTDWKIRAIKLLILLDKRGFVTRADLKVLGLSPSRWTAPGGFLKAENGAYVRYERTPDFRLEHPTNTAQIEASFATWAPPPSGVQQTLMVIPGAKP